MFPSVCCFGQQTEEFGSELQETQLVLYSYFFAFTVSVPLLCLHYKLDDVRSAAQVAVIVQDVEAKRRPRLNMCY